MPKNGVTLRKKREIEEKLEAIEKQRTALRSKLRLTLGK